jgi:hypothetical protein
VTTALAADGPPPARAAAPSAVQTALLRLKLQRDSFDFGPRFESSMLLEDRGAAGTRSSRGMFSRVPPNDDLPSLGPDGPRVRVMSPLEIFARRAHREGLPLARLFENRSMLISLGLNPKGKFGLWLIQKVP